MTILIGSEVDTYRTTQIPSGVPRVMHEVHRSLAPRLRQQGAQLAPVSTHEASDSDVVLGHYADRDAVFQAPPATLDEVDALLLLEPSPRIAYPRILQQRRTRRLPVVAAIYDVLPVHHPEWFSTRASRDYRVIFQQVLFVADCIVVNSEQVHDDLMGLGWQIRPEIHLIPLGTWLPQQPPRIRSDETHHLIYVSTLAPRKGHELLLRVFDALRLQGLDIRLTIVGRVGWRVDDLVPQILDHPDFGDRLRWFHNADDEQMVDLMRTATMAVVPAEGEGFGLAIEEALASGLIVVATDLPVFRERPNPNLIYAQNSVEGFVEAIGEATRRDPVPLEPGEVRSISAFGHAVGDLVLSLVNDEGGSRGRH